MEKVKRKSESEVAPHDWNLILLGDLVEKIGSGITPTGGEKVYKTEGRTFLRSQNVGWGSLLLEDVSYIDEQTHSSFPSTEIKLNDVFLNITGASIGRSAIADKRVVGGNVNQHVCIIRTFQTILNPNFLNYFLLSNSGQKQIEAFQSGGNRQGLNFAQIANIEIPLPPDILEQEVIVTALSDADNYIAKLEKLIEKKRLIKQGTMQKLLSPKAHWITKNLGEIAEVIMGQSPLSVFYNTKGNGMPLIQGNADIKNRRTIIRFYTSSITKKGKVGDIIMSVRAPVGEISKATFNCCIGRGVCAIRYKNEFLYHYLVYFENSWTKYSTGSTFDSVNSAQVRALEIPIPEEEEQISISSILDSIDSEISILENQLSKAQSIKQGMMQQLLTGKIRLV